jgi:hypothetical protein
MLFQVVRFEYSENGSVLERQGTEPTFELREHALAMAEFEAVRCYDEFEYDNEHDCWTVRDCRNRTFRLVVEGINSDDIAA